MACSEETKRKIGLANAFTYEQVKNFIEIESNSGCKLKSKTYLNSNKNLKIQCKCGNIFDTTFNKFKNRNKRQCNECSGVSRWTLEKIKEVFYKNNLQIIYDNEKINAKTKFKAKTKDNYLVAVSVDKLSSREDKPDIFSKYNPYTIYNIKLWIIRNAKGYELLSDTYIKNTSLLKFKCPNNHNFEMTWADFQSGHRCTKCHGSQGEKRISNWLDSNNIIYKPQYTFNNLRGKLNQPLRFDFGILDDNNKLLCLIEYDGEFHYKPARYSKDKDKMLKKLKEVQHRDKIKNDYCNKNNIPLLRISYTEFNNIEKILDTYISVFFN